MGAFVARLAALAVSPDASTYTVVDMLAGAKIQGTQKTADASTNDSGGYEQNLPTWKSGTFRFDFVTSEGSAPQEMLWAAWIAGTQLYWRVHARGNVVGAIQVIVRGTITGIELVNATETTSRFAVNVQWTANPSRAGLVALPTPYIYYPFDGDLLNYGSTAGLYDAALQGSGGTFVAGSMPGTQALRLTTSSWVQIGGGFVPMPGTGDVTLSAHCRLTDATGAAFLLSARRSTTSEGVEMIAESIAAGNARSHVLVMFQPGGGYVLADVLGNGVGFANDPTWNLATFTLDRDALARGGVDGVVGPATLDISTSDGIDMFAATFGSVLGNIGSRRTSASTVPRAVDLQEWVWWTEVLSAAQQATLQSLRTQGVKLRDFL